MNKINIWRVVTFLVCKIIHVLCLKGCPLVDGLPARNVVTMREALEGVGITLGELRPGTAVMVPMGRIGGAVGQPCVIAWAVVGGPASFVEGRPCADDLWWLDVYAIPGGPPIPQVYRADEILGVPALGLRMDGAPPRT